MVNKQIRFRIGTQVYNTPTGLVGFVTSQDEQDSEWVQVRLWEIPGKRLQRFTSRTSVPIKRELLVKLSHSNSPVHPAVIDRWLRDLGYQEKALLWDAWEQSRRDENGTTLLIPGVDRRVVFYVSHENIEKGISAFLGKPHSYDPGDDRFNRDGVAVVWEIDGDMSAYDKVEIEDIRNGCADTRDILNLMAWLGAAEKGTYVIEVW